MQFKVVLSVLSLALAASAAPSAAPNGSTTPAQTCNSTPGKATYCCNSFSSGLGLGLDCLVSVLNVGCNSNQQTVCCNKVSSNSLITVIGSCSNIGINL